MAHYITSFIVYTFAMVGILVVAFVVYKKTMAVNPQRKNSLLNVIDMMRLPDRKILYVIKCDNERFLIASSNDNVNLISKLGKNQENLLEELSDDNLTLKSQEDSDGFSKNLKLKNSSIKNLLKELSDNNKTKRGNY